MCAAQESRQPARPGADPLWRAARAAFLPLKSLPKQAPKPADYRVNAAFKSHLLVRKARPRRQRRSQEPLWGAGAVQLSCSVRIWPGLRPAPCSQTPATRSRPGDGAFERSQRCADALDCLYPSSPFPNPRAPRRAAFPSCPTLSFPEDGPDAARVLRGGHWRAFLFHATAGTVPDSLPEVSGPGAALRPRGTDERPCAGSVPLPALPARLRDWPQFMLMG